MSSVNKPAAFAPACAAGDRTGRHLLLMAELSYRSGLLPGHPLFAP